MRSSPGLAFLFVAFFCTAVDGCSSDDTAVSGAADAATDGAANAPGDSAVEGGAAKSLGAACKGDADCNAGLFCYNAESGIDHWPASGMCAARCTDDKSCTALEPGAKCWSLATRDKLCYAGCTLGGPVTGVTTALNPSKCGGRSDLGCYKPTDNTDPFCAPSCNDDSACAAGEKCDLGRGFCSKTSTANAGDIGLGYKRDGGTEIACSTTYRRIDAPADVLYCSAPCVVGVLPACGWNGTGKANAGCIFAPTGGGAGDLGNCAELCDCDSDCRAPLRCREVDPQLANGYGRAGACGGTGPLVAACADAGSAADAGDAGDAATD
ncbi:MAG: hypothetical protein IPG50_11905 [Myxococcales bacterium]|nr:hypothetical protein [Myxococcales bacterium]